MNLKPQDILIALKLVAIQEKPWTYAILAVELGMSPAEVHAACKRLRAAQLVVDSGDKLVPNRTNLVEFLTHGLRYVFVPERGEMTRGLPTMHAAPPLEEHYVSDAEPVPVWPDPNGEARGSAFSPLYKSAPKAARRDPALYELLVLVDAIRGGRARERELALKEIKQRITGDE